MKVRLLQQIKQKRQGSDVLKNWDIYNYMYTMHSNHIIYITVEVLYMHTKIVSFVM